MTSARYRLNAALARKVNRQILDARALDRLRVELHELQHVVGSVAEEDVFLRAIEIHPDYQGQGIGTAIIQKLIAQAALKMKPVFLQVLKVNPAKKLYERLGFSVGSETSTHFPLRPPLSK